MAVINGNYRKLQAGYLFFTSHKDEYDNGSYYILFKRYF